MPQISSILERRTSINAILKNLQIDSLVRSLLVRPSMPSFFQPLQVPRVRTGRQMEEVTRTKSLASPGVQTGSKTESHTSSRQVVLNTNSRFQISRVTWNSCLYTWLEPNPPQDGLLLSCTTSQQLKERVGEAILSIEHTMLKSLLKNSSSTKHSYLTQQTFYELHSRRNRTKTYPCVESSSAWGVHTWSGANLKDATA